MMWLSSTAYADYLPVKASKVAGEVDAVYNFILFWSIVSFILLMGGMVYFIIRYRRKSDNDKVAYITHDHRLEFLWSFIPFCLFMAIFGWGWVVYKKMRTFPDDAYQIAITGKKWAWTMKYNNGAELVNEMYVPANRPVVLNMTSEDVLHSFYIPSFRVKQDVVPGKRSKLAFEATEPGEYRIFCTEYCGTQHSTMMGLVHVLPQNEFEEWEKANAVTGELSVADKGKKLYKTQACFTCHSLDGSKLVGPSFKGLYGRDEKLEGGATAKVDDEYLRESILNPMAKIVAGYPPSMPPYQGRLSEDDLSALIEYIKTIQ